MDLATQKCEPYEVGAPTLKGDELKEYFDSVSGWQGHGGDTKIKKEYSFKDFTQAIEFINKVAAIAQEQNHHPDIYLHDFNKVEITLWTHKIGGLHKNDFILAGKIDTLDHK